MSNDEKKFQPIFQILHIKSAWFLLQLAMAFVTTIGMRFLQVWLGNPNIHLSRYVPAYPLQNKEFMVLVLTYVLSYCAILMIGFPYHGICYAITLYQRCQYRKEVCTYV